MAEKQERTLNFTCSNTQCNHENTYRVSLLVGNTSDGSDSQMLRCKNCGFENTVRLTGYRFPNNNDVLRGG
jgi:transcription elongation factor Elf1